MSFWLPRHWVVWRGAGPCPGVRPSRRRPLRGTAGRAVDSRRTMKRYGREEYAGGPRRPSRDSRPPTAETRRTLYERLTQCNAPRLEVREADSMQTIFRPAETRRGLPRGRDIGRDCTRHHAHLHVRRPPAPSLAALSLAGACPWRPCPWPFCPRATPRRPQYVHATGRVRRRALTARRDAES